MEIPFLTPIFIQFLLAIFAIKHLVLPLMVHCPGTMKMIALETGGDIVREYDHSIFEKQQEEDEKNKYQKYEPSMFQKNCRIIILCLYC